MERFDAAGSGGIGMRCFLGDVEPLQLSQMGLLYSLRSTIPDFRNACSRVLRVSAFRSPMRRGGGSCCATYHAADEVMCGRIE